MNVMRHIKCGDEGGQGQTPVIPGDAAWAECTNIQRRAVIPAQTLKLMKIRAVRQPSECLVPLLTGDAEPGCVEMVKPKQDERPGDAVAAMALRSEIHFRVVLRFKLFNRQLLLP